MIVNLFNTERFPKIKYYLRVLSNVYGDLKNRFHFGTLYRDAIHLKKLFKYNSPRLIKKDDGSTFCVTCFLCQDICPVNSIKLIKPNMVNFPESLTTGEAPLHFYLNVDSCTNCGQCVDVCAVAALDLKGDYKMDKVDLVTKNAGPA